MSVPHTCTAMTPDSLSSTAILPTKETLALNELMLRLLQTHKTKYCYLVMRYSSFRLCGTNFNNAKKLTGGILINNPAVAKTALNRST